MSLPELPPLGSRVSVRYRSPAADKPLTDVIGYLEALAPVLAIRTKSDGLVEFAREAVISVRELSHVPVRTSEIRALEHAAALAWPGTEHQWRAGWFLRAGRGVTRRANSAVPLDFSAGLDALPEIVEWYRGRALAPWVALPERLLAVRTPGVRQTRVMVRDTAGGGAGEVDLTPQPDRAWMALYGRDVPVDILTAVVDGEVVFASAHGAAVGRGAVTTAPDGTRWVGISSVRVDPSRRREGLARQVCAALLAWGVGRGAQRCFVEVLAENTAASTLYASMGFGLHHRRRYAAAQSLLAHTI
jgi:N-acetylglutamate synthase